MWWRQKNPELWDSLDSFLDSYEKGANTPNLRDRIKRTTPRTDELDDLLEEYNNMEEQTQRWLNDTKLENKIEEVQSIELDYSIDVPKWTEYRESTLQKAKESWMSEENLAVYTEFVDTYMAWYIKQLKKSTDEISASKVGWHLDDLTDRINSANVLTDGTTIKIELSELWIGDTVMSFLAPAMQKMWLNFINPKSNNWTLYFDSKEQWVEFVKHLKTWIQDYEAFSIMDMIENTAQWVIWRIALGVWTLWVGEVQRWWWSALKYDAEVIGNLFLEWSFVTGAAVVAAHAGWIFWLKKWLLDRSQSWVPSKLFDDIDSKVKILETLIGQANFNHTLDPQIDNIRWLSKRLSDSNIETVAWSRDNYKIMKKYYTYLNSFQRWGILNWTNSFFWHIGSFIDNWKLLKLPNSEEKLVSTVKFWLDIALLPYKMVNAFVNRWPDNWEIMSTKWDTLHAYDRRLNEVITKFESLWKIVDQVPGLNVTEARDLKSKIYKAYNVANSKDAHSPLKTHSSWNVLGMSLWVKVKSLDSIAAKILEETLVEKFGPNTQLKWKTKQLINTLQSRHSDFEKSRTAIEDRKLELKTIFEYHPSIDAVSEEKIIKGLDILSNLSLKESDLDDAVLNIFHDAGFDLHSDFETLTWETSRWKSIKNILTGLSEALKGDSINISESTNNRYLREQFGKLLRGLWLSNTEESKRSSAFNNLIMKWKNRTYLNSHLVVVFDSILHWININPDIDTFSLKEMIQSSNDRWYNDVRSYVWSKETHIWTFDLVDKPLMKNIEDAIKIAYLHWNEKLVFEYMTIQKEILDGSHTFSISTHPSPVGPVTSNSLVNKITLDFSDAGYELYVLDNDDLKIVQKIKKDFFKKWLNFWEIRKILTDYNDKPFIPHLLRSLKKWNF